MKKRSNKNSIYRNGRSDLVQITHSNNTFNSTRYYNVLVTIVYATGIMDSIGSCILLYCCSEMLETLKELEEFNLLFPDFTAALSKLFADATAIYAGLDNQGLNMEEHQHILIMAIMIMKASFVLLLGIALYFIILSGILFRGIGKKNPTCCQIWNVCLCLTLVIYFSLALIVSLFNFFQLSSQMWMMVCSYGFYRFATICAVYKFQCRFLFISKTNDHTI